MRWTEQLERGRMEEVSLSPPTDLLRGLLRSQLALTIIAGVVAAWLGDRADAAAALGGGGIAWSGSLVAALVVLAAGARTPGGALAAQLGGEGAKVVWTVAMFWLALVPSAAPPLPLAGGFCAAMLGYLAVPVLGASQRRRGRGA